MTPNLAVVILKWREQYMKPCLAIASEKLFFVVDFLLIRTVKYIFILIENCVVSVLKII